MSNIQIINENCLNVIDEIIYNTKNPVIVTEDEYYKMLALIGKKCPTVFIHYPECINEISIAMNQAPERIISWVYPSNTARQHRDIAFYGIKPDMNRVRQPYKNPDDKRVKELQKRTGGCKMYDWIEMNQVKNVSKEKTAHPCQMPLELMRKIVKLLPDGVTVVDPFLGSGTTALACKCENIDCIGIELDSLYFEIAKKRIEVEK